MLYISTIVIACLQEKHEPVCKKLSNLNRKPFDSGKQRATGSDISIQDVRKARKEKEQVRIFSHIADRVFCCVPRLNCANVILRSEDSFLDRKPIGGNDIRHSLKQFLRVKR